MTPRIVVLGKNGQVGSQLMQLGRRQVTGLSREECDITDAGSLGRVFEQHRPNVVINATAYTAVDRAESFPDDARLVNATSLRHLSLLANEYKALLVHYSTDYVFAGDKRGPYLVNDVTMPTSVYGKTKLEGENILLENCAEGVVFRTSWVFGPVGGNFLKTMLRLACEREALRVVADQHGAPTSAMLIAETTANFIDRYFQADERQRESMRGIYHLTAHGDVSWYDYAKFVIAEARLRGWPILVKDEDISPIRTDEYPLPAPRPANSRLDTSKLEGLLNIKLPDWTEGVRSVLDVLVDEAK